jgi:hypothetical protein
MDSRTSSQVLHPTARSGNASLHVHLSNDLRPPRRFLCVLVGLCPPLKLLGAFIARNRLQFIIIKSTRMAASPSSLQRDGRRGSQR